METLIKLIETNYYDYPWRNDDTTYLKLENLKSYEFTRMNTTQFDWGGHVDDEIIAIWTNLSDEARLMALYYASKLARIANDMAD